MTTTNDLPKTSTLAEQSRDSDKHNVCFPNYWLTARGQQVSRRGRQLSPTLISFCLCHLQPVTFKVIWSCPQRREYEQGSLVRTSYGKGTRHSCLHSVGKNLVMWQQHPITREAGMYLAMYFQKEASRFGDLLAVQAETYMKMTCFPILSLLQLEIFCIGTSM